MSGWLGSLIGRRTCLNRSRLAGFPFAASCPLIGVWIETCNGSPAAPLRKPRRQGGTIWGRRRSPFGRCAWLGQDHGARGAGGNQSGAAVVIPDIDIWRCANLLIRWHGKGAVLEVAQRADALLDEGEMDGCRVWQRIVKAIEEMERTDRMVGKPLN